MFRFTSAALTSDIFLKPENWGCPGTLGLVQSKLFSKTLLPLMALEAANSFLLASASSLVFRGGSSGLSSCAPLIWTSQEPYSGIFTMPLQREISFSFFSVLAGAIFSLSLTIFCLIPPPTCQGHSSNICMVLRGRWLWSAASHSRQRCNTVFVQQQFSIFLQDHTVLCSSLLVGRPLLQGQLAWIGELLGAATSSQYYLGIPMLFL